MRWSDWLLVACAASLVVVGPIMALQEFAQARAAHAQFVVTGEVPPTDPSFRVVWRIPLTALVLVTGLAGTVALVRVMADPLVRSVTKRLVALLVLGMALVDVAYYVDGYLFLDAPYALRGATIVWLYPLAGLLLAGSVHRLAEIQSYFRPERGAQFRL